MKTNKKYFLLSLATVVTVAGASFGVLSFAQTTPVLGCSVNAPSVSVGQAAILTATGGSGYYSWSGTDLSITNAAGTQFAVSYPNPGIYPITVSSEGQTATCNVNVVGAATTGGISCFPAVQTVTLGQVATVAASGGNGAFLWSSPDLTIANPSGSGFSASYATTGLKTLTVASAGYVTTCAVNVLSNGSALPVVTTPTLPNTGGGYGK
jgi:hypothetical protein